MLWKSVAVTLALILGTYISVSQSRTVPDPESYRKSVRPFDPYEDRFPEPKEYCYDGVVYIGFWYGNASWGSVKFDSKTKQVVTCK